MPAGQAGEQVVALVAVQVGASGGGGDDGFASIPGLVAIAVANEVDADARERGVASIEDAVPVGVEEDQVADGT